MWFYSKFQERYFGHSFHNKNANLVWETQAAENKQAAK